MVTMKIEPTINGALANICLTLQHLEDRIAVLEAQSKSVTTTQVEAWMRYEAARAQAQQTRQASSATQQGATNPDSAVQRSNVETIMTLSAFARRLIDFHDLGYSVSQEVRDLAVEALGLKRIA